jgi:hypothetical protein
MAHLGDDLEASPGASPRTNPFASAFLALEGPFPQARARSARSRKHADHFLPRLFVKE